MTAYWPYYTLRDGKLFNELGRRVFPTAPIFANAVEAEAWLELHDERGNVR